MPAILKIEHIIEILKAEFNDIRCVNIKSGQQITGIETDSRRLKKGNLFCCIKGFVSDGHQYYKQAEEQGCSLFICEQELPISTSQIILNDARSAAGILAREFFDLRELELVGITGTNGKTTTAYLAWQLAKACGKDAAYLGTIGCYYKDKQISTSLTTPDIIDLYNLLYELQREGIKQVFLEVSSHALAMKRLDTFKFKSAAFLNLSQDHLDFHASMEEYAETKYKLFDLVKEDGKALINTDTNFGRKLYDKIKGNKFSMGCNESHITYNNIIFTNTTSEFTLTIGNETERVESPLIGRFNIENLAAAIALVRYTYNDLDLRETASHTKFIEPVPGRLEKADNTMGRAIYIDYAHTPDAIEKVCAAVKPFVRGRLITIIGAGGNRDKTKRPEMLKAALKDSDLVIVTSDNPRFEEPVAIIRDIVKNTEPSNPVWIKLNREEAIEDALNVSSSEDIILLTGKGHEQYQDIKGTKLAFDEKEIIMQRSNLLNKEKKPIDFDSIMIEYATTGEIVDQRNKKVSNILTDTRKIKPGSLFIPIKGERFNGHEFISGVLKDASCITLTEETYNQYNDRVIKVKNTLESYGSIARSYRMLLGTRILAITGSTGKTSVKEYLSFLMKEKGKTAKTQSNENNFIGTAKTLLSLEPEDEYGVIEIGTNHFGEIDWLTSITLPDVSIITNIGSSHLEFLKNLDGVFKEKTAIFKYGCEKKIYPGDDEHFSDIDGIGFGFREHNKYRFSELRKCRDGFQINVNEDEFHLNVQATFQALNASIAIAIAHEEGLTALQIENALEKLPHVEKRLQLIDHKEGKVISDCYNANPDSMKAAIEYWKGFEAGKPHIAILGSMLELGNGSIRFHKQAGKQVRDCKPELFVSVGEDAKDYHADIHFSNVEKLIDSFGRLNIADNSIILVKGSHSIHLERIIEEIL